MAASGQCLYFILGEEPGEKNYKMPFLYSFFFAGGFAHFAVTCIAIF